MKGRSGSTRIRPEVLRSEEFEVEIHFAIEVETKMACEKWERGRWGSGRKRMVGEFGVATERPRRSAMIRLLH